MRIRWIEAAITISRYNSCCNNRPIAELLRPNFKELAALYDGEFNNMAEHEIPLAELEETRSR